MAQEDYQNTRRQLSDNQKRKKKKGAGGLLWILLGSGIGLVVVIAVFFFVVKPRMDGAHREELQSETQPPVIRLSDSAQTEADDTTVPGAQPDAMITSANPSGQQGADQPAIPESSGQQGADQPAIAESSGQQGADQPAIPESSGQQSTDQPAIPESSGQQSADLPAAPETEVPKNGESPVQARETLYSVIKCEDDIHYTFIRREKSEESGKLLKLRKHNVVSVSEIQSDGVCDWGHVSYYGCTGWVKMQYLQKVMQTASLIGQPGKYYVFVQEMNLRGGASEDSESLGKLPYGAEPEITSTADGWGEVSWSGMHGYLYMPCISQYRQGAYTVNTDSDYGIHFRAAPGSDQEAIGTIPNGTAVPITEFRNGWGKTSYNGQTGWVELKRMYLS